MALNVHVSFNLKMVVAILLGELISGLWYSGFQHWGRDLGDRYLITALICDIGLVIVLQNLTSRFVSIRRWEEAIRFSIWMALAVAALEGPHVVYGIRTFTYFILHILHKFTMILVMLLVLLYFKY